MSNNQHEKEQSRHRVPSSHHDSAWEHHPAEHPNSASCHHAVRETHVSSEIADIETTLSGTTFLEASLDQQPSTRWEQTLRYESTNFQGLRCSSDNSTDAPYSSKLSSDATPTSHSSPAEMMDPSSTIEASTPESPDSGASDQDKNSSSRRIGVGHPRPFSRKSKAGNPHTVTPSAAGPEGGFICKFSENEKICGNTFKLPSDIRFHLIEDHMDFSPFQCEKCMRIYTRKSLYTRHLKEVSQEEDSARRTRQCPHRVAAPDDAFRSRKNTYEALWAIQLTQDQVDGAVNIIKQYNGSLPSRRRRTQNINMPDASIRITSEPELEAQAVQSASHYCQQGSERDYPTQQDSPPFGSHACPSTLLRSLSAPDLVPQTRSTNEYPTQSPMTTPTEVHSRSPVPAFGSNQSFHSVSTYSSEQESSSLPTVQQTFHRYAEIGAPLYGPTPRIPGFFGQPQELIESIPTVNPHVLHQAASHRHNSWDGSGVGSNDDDTHRAWTPTTPSQSYRHQISFGDESPEYKESYRYSTTPQNEHIQDDSSRLTPSIRQFSFQDEFRGEDAKSS